MKEIALHDIGVQVHVASLASAFVCALEYKQQYFHFFCALWPICSWTVNVCVHSLLHAGLGQWRLVKDHEGPHSPSRECSLFLSDLQCSLFLTLQPSVTFELIEGG